MNRPYKITKHITQAKSLNRCFVGLFLIPEGHMFIAVLYTKTFDPAGSHI